MTDYAAAWNRRLLKGWRRWFYRGTRRANRYRAGHLATGAALYMSVHTR